MESPANIGICETKQPNPKFGNLPIHSFFGKYCKLGFICPNGRNEYMWVLVKGKAKHKSEELRGVLNNDPIFAQYTCGDVFEFKRSEIIDVCGGD